MRKRSVFLALGVLVIAALAAGPAFSSGGNPGGGYGDNRGGVRSNVEYDRGKALFQGRAREHRGLSVCFSSVDAEEPIEISRGTTEPFRGMATADFATRLVACNDPDAGPLAQQLQPTDLLALLHYLDKRYSLRLKS